METLLQLQLCAFNYNNLRSCQNCPTKLFSLTLSICKHSPQLDTPCRPCTPRSRRQIYVQKEPCVFAVRSRLRNVKSLQTLHQFWSGFELRCLLPPNASASPHREQPTREQAKINKKIEGRESELVFVYWLSEVGVWLMWCHGETFVFLCVWAEWGAAVVVGLKCSNSRRRVKEFQWAVGLNQQLPARRPWKIHRKIFLLFTRQNPTCVDRLLRQTRGLVPNSFFTCCIILLPKWTPPPGSCRCQSNGGGGVCLWDHMTHWIPTCVAVN